MVQETKEGAMQRKEIIEQLEGMRDNKDTAEIFMREAEHWKSSADRLAKIIDAGPVYKLYRQFRRDAARIMREYNAGLKRIDALDDQQQRDALYFHYVEGLTIEQTARKMAYSPGQVYRFRDAAINALEASKKKSKGDHSND